RLPRQKRPLLPLTPCSSSPVVICPILGNGPTHLTSDGHRPELGVSPTATRSPTRGPLILAPLLTVMELDFRPRTVFNSPDRSASPRANALSALSLPSIVSF